MKTLFRTLLLAGVCAMFFSSCKVIRFMRPSILLRAPNNYPYLSVSDTMSKIFYKLEPANVLKISISPNDGFNKVNFMAESGQLQGNNFIDVLVEMDGTIKLPLIGHLKVAGKTTRELEDELESLYQNYYVKPFVTILVSNQRYTVFPGNGGSGRVIALKDYNTTLYEAIGQAGGINEDGKAYKIKLVRNENGQSKVYRVDLSTIEGIRQGNMIIMANDIIYVESRMRFAQRFLSEITPFLTLFSTSLVLYSVIKK
jgi:polysaccharide biosynthesis/export protein